MNTTKLFRNPVSCFFAVAVFCGGSVAGLSGQEALTAAGKPVEGPLDPFLGKPFFDKQIVFDEEGNKVREPYLAIAIDGTLLAMRNNKGHLRRSDNGGKSWWEIIAVPISHSDRNMIVDESTGDILSVRMWNGRDRLFRSRDHGKTWTEEEITLKPSEPMVRSENTGSKKRVTKVAPAQSGTYYC